MLKKFFLNVLSSFVGAWIAIVLFGVVAFLVCVGIVAKLGMSSSEGSSIEKGSVLTISLNGAIEERETPLDIDYISLISRDLSRPQSLASLVTAIGEAKENKNVKAIYLKGGMASASLATLNALRDALLDFKKSGKQIIAYADSYMSGSYYVASVADKIYLNPAGEVALKGIGGTSLYFKNLLDKIGVQVQVVKVGTYKSAVEPYILSEMSAPARAQLDTLYGYVWSYIRENISSQRRKLSPVAIDSLVSKDFIFIAPAEKDEKCGLVDGLIYERSMDSIIAKSIGKEKDKLSFISPDMMLGQTSWGQQYGSKKQIAVLYATGEIVDGGGSGTIDFESLVPQIVKLAENDKVKGMVLRVNSPGGAVFGSTQIGEALDYFQSKGKPLAVSMGDYAASGGYWISCCANRIFADPLTITGSIGIFGLIPNVSGLMDKIGVTPQLVSTNPEAQFPAFVTPMNETQQAGMQAFVERGYDTFVARVARGRKMTEEKVRTIGEGRVWSAGKALEIGLIDQLGGLGQAVEWVSKQCKLGKDPDVAIYPTIESTVWDMLPELGNIKAKEALVNILGGDHNRLGADFLMKFLRQKPLQARMPMIEVRFMDTLRVN